MNKLLSAASAIAIGIAGSAAQAAVVLTDENLDTVTAGAAFTINTNGINTNTDFKAMFIALAGMTLVGQCTGNNCTINVNGAICSSCTLVINESGTTVTDASGISYRASACLRADPQNSGVMVVSAK